MKRQPKKSLHSTQPVRYPTKRGQKIPGDVSARERLAQAARKNGWRLRENQWRVLICRHGPYVLYVQFSGSGTASARLGQDGQNSPLAQISPSTRNKFDKAVELLERYGDDRFLMS